MNTAERAQARRKLIAAGIRTSGLSDDEITAELSKLGTQSAKQATQAVKAADPEPTPSSPAKTSQKADLTLSDALSLIQDRLEHPQAATLDESRVVELIKKHSHVTVDHVVHVHTTGKEPVKIASAHPALTQILDVHAIGENCYLQGPASSGKTTLAKQTSKALQLPFHFTGAVVDKFELLGFVDAGGKYHRTPLREAVEHGGVFLFDEVDSSYPAPLNAFNALLENGWITFPDGATFQVDRSKTFFICAANTIGTGANRTYVGRFELDRAFLDRFVQIDVDYDTSIEDRMAVSSWIAAGGDPNSNIPQIWAKDVRKFRSKLAAKNIQVLVTPRATRRGAGLLARGWSVDQVTEAELLKHLSTDQRKQVTK